MEYIEVNQYHAYLCILTDGEGGYDCYGCDSEDEVFELLSSVIFEELEHIEDEDYRLDNIESQMFATMVKSKQVIKTPEIIRKCFELFIYNQGFYVIRAEGSLWFGWY